MCELRPSNIPGAGLGVFTTRDFKTDEFICHYDFMRIADPDEKLLEQDRKYGIIVDNKWYIGDWTSKIAGAQFINDVAALPQHMHKDSGETYVSYEQFYQIGQYFTTIVQCNVYNKGLDFYCLRNIPAGTELLFHYGYTYWTCSKIAIIDQMLNDIRRRSLPPQMEVVMIHKAGIWLMKHA